MALSRDERAVSRAASSVHLPYIHHGELTGVGVLAPGPVGVSSSSILHQPHGAVSIPIHTRIHTKVRWKLAVSGY